MSNLNVRNFAKKYGIFETPVFGSKNPIFKAKTGVSVNSEFTEYSEFVLFKIFQKLHKNYVKIQFLFLQKTHSDLNSNSNI
jgi:hypothetical protein